LVEAGLINSPAATFLLSIKEDSDSLKYGVCFVDAATGEVVSFFLSFLRKKSNSHLLKKCFFATKKKNSSMLVSFTMINIVRN
jgi:hypothetical protein